MPLLEAVGMKPTSENFIVAIAFIRNEHDTTYRWVFEQIKHLYVSSAMPTGNESIINYGEPIVIITDRESGLMPVIKDVFSKSYHMLWLKMKRSQLGSSMAPGKN
ncbi:hypothetical protein M9H77_36445 [Catharanthus roseus]|uniref:Uncharacterized protein n=1 Tax=Catharanthus roseus TaxID=4058 RepID=A0ACB9ZVK3_CATRO|nr:hypothetical protein M9H77_36445 [Catharanthus roseus]